MDRQREIETIEDELVKNKPWFEKGEVSVRERPKNSLLFDEDCDSDEFVRNIEFIRNKTTVKIENTVDIAIERIVKEKLKNKQYDNPRKTAKKEEVPISEEVKKEEKTAVHDILEGRKSENDKFMEPSEIVRLFNEIDKSIAELTDRSYVVSRPMQIQE